MESLIHHFKIVTEGYRVPEARSTSPSSRRAGARLLPALRRRAEAVAREFRAPSFVATPAAATISRNALVADLIAIVGSLDGVMGEVDRWRPTARPLYDEIQELIALYPSRGPRPCPLAAWRRSATAGSPPMRSARSRGLGGAPALPRGGRVLLRHVPPRADRPAPRRGSARTSPAPSSARSRCSRHSSRSSAYGPARRPTTARSPCARSSAPAATAGAPSSRSTIAHREPVRAEDVPAIVEELAVADEVRRIVLAGAEEGRDLTTLAGYREVGGYAVAHEGPRARAAGGRRRAAPRRTCAAAAGPTSRWTKASFLAKGTGRPTYLVVNADESEPGRSRTARSCSPSRTG